MNTDILFAVIALQVMVFQFLSGRFVRAMGDYRVGLRDLPLGVAAQLETARRKTTAFRIAAGALLLIAALLFAFLLPVDYRLRKLALAAVSLASSLGFLLTWTMTHRATLRISTHLPQPALLSASLERRTLSRFYPLVLEALPVGLMFATIAFTIWARPHFLNPTGDQGASVSVWILPFLQITLLILGFVMSLRLVEKARHVPQRARPHLASPEQAVRLDERLRALEIRTFFVIKCSVVLLLGAMQAKQILGLVGGSASLWLSRSIWILVAAMLVVFARFILQLIGTRKGLRISG